MNKMDREERPGTPFDIDFEEVREAVDRMMSCTSSLPLYLYRSKVEKSFQLEEELAGTMVRLVYDV